MVLRPSRSVRGENPSAGPAAVRGEKDRTSLQMPGDVASQTDGIVSMEVSTSAAWLGPDITSV